MTLIYVTRLGFATRKTDVGTQKIDCLLLKIYEIAIAWFLLQDRLEKI